jgi:hypothetical protein
VTLRRAAAGALCAAVTILVVPATAASASTTLHAANYFRASGVYDCSAYQAVTGLFTYVDTYKFGKHRTYKFGLMGPKSTKFHGHVSAGRYKVAGLKIIPTSGGLKKDGMFLLIQASDLALVKNNGAFTGIGCRLRGAKPQSQPPAGSALIGAWECYDTVRQGSTVFQLFFKRELTFWSDGTYLASGGIRMQGWKQSGSAVQFTGGSLWSAFVHDAGTYFPAGVAMPNATGTAAGPQWKLVVRDTQSNNATPPMTEYAQSVFPSSYDYCRKKP